VRLFLRGCTPAKLFLCKVLLYWLFPLDWTTEITHVSPFKADGNSYYVDEHGLAPMPFGIINGILKR